ncbi:MAG TPA: DUF922 domain-containing protein [Gallionella sp.]
MGAQYCSNPFLRNRQSAPFLLILTTMLPTVAIADVEEHLSYSYYELEVLPELSLRQQLNAASPIKVKGKTFHGYFKWNIEWTFKLKIDKRGVCRILNPSTKLNAEIILPKIYGGNGPQIAVLDSYIAALRRHELKHYSTALQATHAIDNDLHSLQGMHNCASLENYANKRASYIEQQFKAKIQQYDCDTNHGMTEGVCLDD